MTCDRSHDLGGYVLHALEEHEEHAVERHLLDCDECLAELGELAAAASMLALVRVEDLLVPESPRRSRGHRRTALAAAAALIVGSLAAAPLVHRLGDDGGPVSAVVVHGVGATPGVRGEVSIVAGDHGTALHLTLAGAPTHGWCSLVARAADGRTEVAATWPADGAGRVDETATTRIPADQLSGLSVVTGAGRRLLSIPVPGTGA